MSAKQLNCFANPECGDLVFFHRLPQSGKNNFLEAVTLASFLDSNIFHVAIVVDKKLVAKNMVFCNKILVAHATTKLGVTVQSLDDVIAQEEIGFIELCSVQLDSSLKWAAVKWVLAQIGAEYNDLFTSNCLNSQGHRAFYCCQLVSEAFKSVSGGQSPFLPHKLNFSDSSGQLIPYWLDYYSTRCADNLQPPQGEIGTHPSIIRASPCLKLKASVILPIKNLLSKINSKNCSPTSGSDTNSNIFRTLLSFDMRNFIFPKDLYHALHFINGTRVDLKSTSKFDVFEPRNGKLLTQCYSASASQVEEVVNISANAQRTWATTPWAERRQVLQCAANLIRQYCGQIAECETRDNGKSITEARTDVLSCADTFEYYSGIDLSGEHVPYADAQNRFAYTRREPLGVIGAIGAWNYPIQTATWKIAPAIACGNSIVYKPSPLAPVSSVILAQILQCAGLPNGIVNIVQGKEETGAALCLSKLIRKISFTGSIQTGKAIATACAKISLKPVTLELGGKSSCIIFEDSELEMAVHGALMANFYSQGQVCSNASKILVHRSIYDAFTAKLLQKTKELIIGDPLNISTHIGACISLDHVAKVQNHISGAIAQGAKLLYGGEKMTVESMENGYYLSPCVLTNITPAMKIYNEEVFGAVLLIIPFDAEDEALQMANDTDTGLAAGIFTNNLKKAYTFASRLQAGNVYVNTYNDVSPHIPFGGNNQSGYGRENGKVAIEHYTQIKSVFINASGQLENPFPNTTKCFET